MYDGSKKPSTTGINCLKKLSLQKKDYPVKPANILPPIINVSNKTMRPEKTSMLYLGQKTFNKPNK